MKDWKLDLDQCEDAHALYVMLRSLQEADISIGRACEWLRHYILDGVQDNLPDEALMVSDQSDAATWKRALSDLIDCVHAEHGLVKFKDGGVSIFRSAPHCMHCQCADAAKGMIDRGDFNRVRNACILIAGLYGEECSDPKQIAHEALSGTTLPIPTYKALEAENNLLAGYAQHKPNCSLTLSEACEEGTCRVLTPCDCGLQPLIEKWQARHLAKPLL